MRGLRGRCCCVEPSRTLVSRDVSVGLCLCSTHPSVDSRCFHGIAPCCHHLVPAWAARTNWRPLLTSFPSSSRMTGRRFHLSLLACAFLPLCIAQYGRGGYGGYGGGAGAGGAGMYGGGGAGNAVARPGGDSSLDDSVRLFLQLDQDGMACSCMLPNDK